MFQREITQCLVIACFYLHKDITWLNPEYKNIVITYWRKSKLHLGNKYKNGLIAIKKKACSFLSVSYYCISKYQTSEFKFNAENHCIFKVSMQPAFVVFLFLLFSLHPYIPSKNSY